MDPHAIHERSDTLHTILRAAVALSLGDEQADDLTNYDGDDRTLVIRAPAASRAATDTAARTALAIGCPAVTVSTSLPRGITTLTITLPTPIA